MLARIQQFITVTLLVTAVAWAAWAFARGEPAWALGGAAVILFGYAAALAAEFVLLAFVGRDDPAPRPSAAQLLLAWWGEATHAPRVFCWRQPFRSHAEPDHLPPHAPGQTGCLFVHGFVCNRGFWNPWMRRLRAQGVPFIAVDLEPVFGQLDDYVPILEDAVRRLEQATGRAPFVVAHSMGGLAVRAWMKTCATPRAAHVVTIGTPHRGTWLARFSLTPNGLQMRQGSPWLQSLVAAEGKLFERFTCFYGHCDNIVFPPTTATLPGADNRHVPGSAHVHLAFQETVVSQTLDLLESASNDASADGAQAAR